MSDFKFIQDITLDIAQKSYVAVNAKQGDGEAGFIRVHLTQDGVELKAQEDWQAMFRAKKPGGKTIWNTAKIEPEGTVLAELTSETLTKPGLVAADVVLRYGEGKESALSFAINVEPAPVGEMPSDNEFGVFYEALDRANDAADRATAEAADLEEFGKTAKEAEQGRLTAEAGRVEAETARDTAEKKRAQSENERVTAEQGRVSAESGRVSAESDRATAEAERVKNEQARKAAEGERDTAEQGRATAEQGREDAEAQRVAAEKLRQSAETARAEAEKARVDAETQREADTGERLEAMDDATAKLNGLTVTAVAADTAGATLTEVDGHYHLELRLVKGDKGEPGEVTKAELDEAIANITIKMDDTPTDGSKNAVTSEGIYKALQNITIKMDEAPTAGSANAVKSGGVFTALDKKADKKVPSAAGNVATLDATGNLADGGKKYAPADKSVSMTSPVGVDANGKLWTDTQSVKRYTVRWDKTTNQMERLNAAEGIPTDYTHMRYNGTVDPDYSNPFDGIYPWSGIKLCNIDIDVYRKLSAGARVTDCVVAWEGDPDFSYTHANGVWRYHPEFWGRSWEEGGYRYFEITDTALGGFVHYPENIKGRWHGVRVSRSIDGSEKNILLPMANQPCAAEYAVSLMHTEAKNYGATLDSIYTIDADFLLYLVEFANTNAQTVLGNGVASLYQAGNKHPVANATNSTTVTVLTADAGIIIPGALFTIGDTNDRGLVNRAVVKSTAASGANTVVTLDRAVTITTAQFWNIHGLANMADEQIGSRSGYIGVNGKSIAYYRGLEMYGNMFFYVLGAYRAQTTDNVWIAHSIEEADGYDVLNTAVHKDTGVKLASNPDGTDVAWGGYVKTLGLCSGLSVPPFCTEAGGDATRPVGDYLWMPTHATGNTILLLGGSAGVGLGCGPASAHWQHASSDAWWSSSARPSLKNPH